jgi:hypothetical protein
MIKEPLETLLDSATSKLKLNIPTRFTKDLCKCTVKLFTCSLCFSLPQSFDTIHEEVEYDLKAPSLLGRVV